MHAWLYTMFVSICYNKHQVEIVGILIITIKWNFNTKYMYIEGYEISVQKLYLSSVAVINSLSMLCLMQNFRYHSYEKTILKKIKTSDVKQVKQAHLPSHQ